MKSMKPKRKEFREQCETCRHKQLPDGGWCYMFENPPREACMQHTGVKDLAHMLRAAKGKGK